jgi:hypothetical protein
MPTVLREGPYVFAFFATDRVEPRHIHVKRDRQAVKFWLQPVALANNDGFAEHDRAPRTAPSSHVCEGVG